MIVKSQQQRKATVVFQSFRTDNVPHWLTQCMDSVSNWSKQEGYDYRFYDDVFFSYAPLEFRNTVKGQRHLVSDLARLEIAHELLQRYERVIWVDADVYVNNPARFLADLPESEFLFCKEFWVYRESNKIKVAERVNNAVMVFDKNNSFLDFYRYACSQIVKKRNPLAHSALGTIFLTEMHKMLKQPLLHEVAMLSPALFVAIKKEEYALPDTFLKSPAVSIHAANLCLTFFGSTYEGEVLDEEYYYSVIRYLDTI